MAALKIHHLIDEDEKKKGKKKVQFAELPVSEKRERTSSNERKVEIKDEDGEGEEDEDADSGVCILSRVIFKETYGTVTLREIEGADVDGAVLLEGFPGSTFTSMICASCIVDSNHLRLIGTISSDKLPAKSIVENGHATSLIRIMGSKDLVVVQSDVAIPIEISFDMVTAVLEFARRHRCRMIVTMQGLHKGVNDEKLKAVAAAWANRGEADRIDGVAKPKTEDEDPDRVRYLTSDGTLAAALKEAGHKPISAAVISGIPGLILSRGSLVDPYDSSSFWPGFFNRAGVPLEYHAHYKDSLIKAGIDSTLLSDLTKELLDKSGISAPGHQLKMLKQAELESRQKSDKIKESDANHAHSPSSTASSPTHVVNISGRVELTCLLSPSSFTDARSTVAAVKLLKAFILPHLELGTLDEKAEELEIKIRTAIGSPGGDFAGARLAGPTTVFV